MQMKAPNGTMVCLRDNAMWQETLKLQDLELKQENIKDFSLSLRKSLEGCLLYSFPGLMTSALYRTVPPNNPCMLCAPK